MSKNLGPVQRSLLRYLSDRGPAGGYVGRLNSIPGMEGKLVRWMDDVVERLRTRKLIRRTAYRHFTITDLGRKQADEI